MSTVPLGKPDSVTEGLIWDVASVRRRAPKIPGPKFASKMENPLSRLVRTIVGAGVGPEAGGGGREVCADEERPVSSAGFAWGR